MRRSKSTAPSSAAEAALAAQYGASYQALSRRPLPQLPPPGTPRTPNPRLRPIGDFGVPTITGIPGIANPEKKPTLALRALSRLTYGLTETSLAEYNALGSSSAQRYERFVEQQLAWEAIDDSAVESRLRDNGYTTLDKTLAQLWTDHRQGDPAYNVRVRPAEEVKRSAMVRAIHSRRQLYEIMVMFWHDHFNVTASDFEAAPVYVHYDRNVIRGNALGNFRAMIQAVASSTAMLWYLDNRSNTVAGPNENFARELFELHGMGAENYVGLKTPSQIPPCPEDPTLPIGYSDIDVYESARCFTGWTIDYTTGTFRYDAGAHDSGYKTVLGREIPPAQAARKDGNDILDRIATHPRAARYICRKLIRRLFEDTPPQSLVDSAAVVFSSNWQAPDQIRIVMRHILLSDYARTTTVSKRRRPFEAIAGAMRGLGSSWTLKLDDDRGNDFSYRLSLTGHMPYDWPAPNGYPDVAAGWSGSNTYGLTWKMLNWLVDTRIGTGPDYNTSPRLAAVVDITRAKVPIWTAKNLVDYWCTRLLGYRPTASRYRTLLAFMAQNGDPAAYVIADTDAYNINDLRRHYNHQRLASMVSLILMSPEFLTR